MDILKQRKRGRALKILSLSLAVMLTLFGFTSCGKNNPVPNVMGTDHSEAKKVLENAGFEVTEIEADAGSILPDSSYNRSVNKGKVFKVNDETKFNYKDYANNMAPDGKVTIYYAKEDYVADDDSNTGDISSAEADAEENKTTTQKKATKKANNTKEKSSVDWKEFLKEYEEWVDSYIELLKKYKDNPSDMSILSEYTEQMNKVSEWSEKAEKIEADLANNPDDLKEYLDTLSRIIKKLSEVE
ncbi:MAG: DUF6591 domain-containing protein [Acutalibacteraceae bacterium]